MQFLTADTRGQLGFGEIWSRIKPVSALGRSLHRQAEAFLPAQKGQLVEEWERLALISAVLRENPKACVGLKTLLSHVPDVTDCINRSLTDSTLSDADFYSIKKLLRVARDIKGELARLGWGGVLPAPLDVCPEVLDALSVGQGDSESFYLADAYHEKLAEIRSKRFALEDKLTQRRKQVEDHVFQAVGRVFSTEDELAVSVSDQETIAVLENIPQLVRSEETPDCVKFRLRLDESARELQRELRAVRAEEEQRKARVRERLTGVIAEQEERLRKTLSILGFLDFLLAKAEFCASCGGVKPNLRDDGVVSIYQGRHLLLEEDVTGRGLAYTPIDLELKRGVTLITGPNMGGKTACLETVGLLLAMAQFGLLVPAEKLEFSPRTFIAARLTAADNPKGLSSFAGEIAFIREVVRVSDQPGLILLDEIAHGTNPTEGAAIAQAVLERLNGQPPITLVTTHYPALAQLEGMGQLRIRGLDHARLAEMWSEDTELDLELFHQAMDYRLEPVKEPHTLKGDVVHLAEALGLDEKIILRAQELVKRGAEHG